MNFKVLGKNSKEKGSQLELITAEILEHLDCKDIVKNHIGPGGDEIDVRAKQEVKGLGDPKIISVICECKATQTPQNLPDWLKFLGKYFSELTKRNNNNVHGYFISLSGVNGNVKGNFEDLKQNTDNIEVITGKRLLNIIRSNYNLSSPQNIKDLLRKRFEIGYEELSLCFYKHSFYWLVEVNEEDYVLFSQKGDIIKPEKVNELKSVIEYSITQINYLDLEEREEILKTKKLIKAEALEVLFNNPSFPIDKISDHFRNSYPPKVTKSCIKELVDQDCFNINNGEIALDYSDLSKKILLAKVLLNNLSVGAFNSDLFQSFIDDSFVEEILKIQHNLPLNEDDKEKVEKIISLSPNALAFSLKPNQMITQHRKDGEVEERIDQHDIAYFKKKIYEQFYYDYRSRRLFEHFFEHDIKELEIEQIIKIKDSKSILIEDETQERLSIGKLTDEHGGGYTSMVILPDVGEPWEENFGQANQKELDTEN